MPSHPFVVFCDQVCKSIRWPPAQRLAREELTAHLEDHAAALEEQGVPPEEAATRAVEAMGDPKEIGQQLDRCHGPFIPRLSQFFAYCACVMFLFGFCIGVLNRSGPFRNDAFLLSSPTYPDWGGTMLCQGDAQGSGSLGGYAISAKDAALIRLPATKYSPSEQEIQATVTVTHWQLWTDHLELSAVPCTWTDPGGASGIVSCYPTRSGLLSKNWILRLEAPTPGCRWFSVTLGRPGDQCTLEITLDEEVPPA